MTSLAEKRHAILKAFLEKWKPDIVRNISLEQYAIGADNYKETFSQWIERDTDTLGRIRGVSGGGSFKFGIFFKDPEKKKSYESYTRYEDDGKYAWEIRFGSERENAFNEIKERINKVIQYSINGDFESIENIDKLFSIVKWKIAFLYSRNKLLPVYSKAYLIKIAEGLGYIGTKPRVVELQKFIMSKRNTQMDFFDWYEYLLNKFIRSQNKFFVVGSKYGKKKSDIILKEMIEGKFVSIGAHREESLERFVGKSKEIISEYLYSKNESQSDVSALTKFLNIGAEDIIAVKNYGFKNNLNIAAYAIVKPDDKGNFYAFDTEYGHKLSVEFIETDVDLNLALNKSHAVHQITEPEEIEEIFGAYQFISTKDTSSKRKSRKGTKTKHTSGHKRTVIYTTIIDEIHNQLQTQFWEYLKEEKNDLDGNYCEMEVGNVDVKFEDNENLELYEVKTSPTPKKCITEALGQILKYASEANSYKSLKLFVVGPGAVTENDLQLINYVKEYLTLHFEYISFPLLQS